MAGAPVRLRLGSAAFADAVLPALRHRPSPPEVPALTVLCVDGGGFPAPAWPGPTGEAWSLHTERIRALGLAGLRSVLWFDRERALAIQWTEDASALPVSERGSPLLMLWAWWLEDRGLSLVHAAALGGEQGAALLVGPGGSGKSSTALACVRPPLRYLADDYCALDPGPVPEVHSLFCTGKVARGDEARFPALGPARAASDHEKVLYVLSPAFADRLSTHLPLRAILIPRVTGGPSTSLAPASARDALRALAPSTLLQLRVGIDAGRALHRLSALTRAVPCHRLDLGTDRDGIRDVLASLLG